MATSAFADPIPVYEDHSVIGSQSQPIDTEVAYWDDYGEEDQWNEISQVHEPRYLAKRSPLPPFDPISKKIVKKNLKKWKPVIKKGTKKVAPPAGAFGAFMLANFGISQLPPLGGLGGLATPGILSTLPSGVWRPSVG